MPGNGNDMNETRPVPLVIAPRHDFASVLIAFREAGLGAQIDLTDSIGQAKALLLYRRTDGATAWVFIDVDFFGDGGLELAQWIKATAGLQTRRIVALVGPGNIRDVSRACEAGADSFLVKPLTSERLSTLSKHDKSRAGLKENLREAVAKNRELQSELRERRAKLDLALAEGKEMKKQIPFSDWKSVDGKKPAT